MSGRFKIFSDPVHGFISVPRGLIFQLIQTAEVQRLRRIRQLGIGHLVFPGAEHSRFGHALGAMALMHDALSSLAEKGTSITTAEHTAALAAALLHDVGHGPFSHTLEHALIKDFEHESMSRVLIARLNERFDGALSLALEMFDNAYARPFFHELISSQLDMDRLDYLRRDSFYTGVVEGRVGVERIIKTIRVHPNDGGPTDRIAVEAKGLHAVENFLIARRLMYWQVYLHKTILAGDHLLRSVVRRARAHLEAGNADAVAGASPAFLYFLSNRFSGADLDRTELVEQYTALDDSDILFSLKTWRHTSDPILSDLSRRMLDRDFFRVSFVSDHSDPAIREAWTSRVRDVLLGARLTSPERADDDTSYYLAFAESGHDAYERSDDSIGVVQRDGTVVELSQATRMSAVSGIIGPEQRPYVCYPKEVRE